MKLPGQKLDELQRWMLAAVTNPAAATEREIREAILPSQQQAAAERLDVYRSAYFARLLDVLCEQFPCTRFAAGEEMFDQLALGYLQAHPPHSYTLGRLADRLPEYLEATRPADWGEFLVELARLEQAIDRVFDGAGPEKLPAFVLPTSANASLRLVFVPGFELHAFRHPVSAFYTDWKAQGAPAWPEPGEQFVALLRRDFIVRRYELTPQQYALLNGLQSGHTLGEALATAASSATDASLNQLAASVRDWFSRWTAGGFFATDRRQVDTD